MDLRQLWAVIWRHRIILALGVVIGLSMATLSLYKVEWSIFDPFGRFVMEPRSLTTYETEVNLVVDVPGFGIGRTDTSIGQGAALASIYAYLVTSDVVMEKVKEELADPDLGASIKGESIKGSPVLRIVVQGNNALHIATVATTSARSLISYLREEQLSNDVPPEKRSIVRILGLPSEPIPLQSRQFEVALILFLASLSAAIALILVLENISQSKAREVAAGQAERRRQVTAQHRLTPGGRPPATPPEHSRKKPPETEVVSQAAGPVAEGAPAFGAGRAPRQ